MVGLGGLMTLSENPEAPETFTRTFIAMVICLGMFILGVWLARWFDDQKSDEEKKSDPRLAHDDGEYKMPEE